MKNHLSLLKETLQFMVQQLRNDDKLCIITFDHEVLLKMAACLLLSSYCIYLTKCSSVGED